MKRNWCLLCVMILLLCAGCGGEQAEMSAGTGETASHEQIAPPEKEERVAVYSDEEITITVPASYEDLVLVDNIGSDNMFVVTANLYYAPAYIASEDGCTPPLCGGWMLTVEWADSQYAASV